MRREDNFQELVKNKKIIIPIIQRDYAQGRNDPKAISVRTRLIDEWIDILQNPNLRMDFNYIYGNETDKIFYPVDGQQRLTSLYLLHWYLAMATDNTGEIDEWKFDYKTRNSASEFFAFLHNVEKSDELFEILHSDKSEADKQADIRNESWFKNKWENDPTVVSCVNFLCMLSGKLSDYEEKFGTFWASLNNTSCPAVYFTCLSDCDDKYAEIDAAKKYTRMNARGKRLTNFENLKAMIDEIETKHIKDLAYCADDEQEALADTISWSYDRAYIDCLYNSMQENSLLEKTNAINEESEKWFRLVYYVYSLVNERNIPSDLSVSTINSNESYEDVIYKISQERVSDDKISKYLYMLKSVFEVLCNSGTELSFKYKDFNIREEYTRIHAIAFVLFVSRLWNRNNNKDDNSLIATKWEQFRSALGDLGFDSWKTAGEKALADIITRMIEGIANTSNTSVDEYFVKTDFEIDSPFVSFEIMDDLKCRVIERKIKSKIILDGAASEVDIDEVPIGRWRWGYLYYICGFLGKWDLGDWSGRAKWDGAKLKAYISLIKETDSFKELMRTREAKAVFAYASQFDSVKKSLLDAININACNNEHVWNHSFLEWDDDEYGNVAEEKIKQLNHMKIMFDLLLDFKTNNNVTDEKIIEKFLDNINKFFDTTKGYEKCWLRFATKYAVGGKELLDYELENDKGIVTLKSVPVIIKTYLVENGHTYIDRIPKLKDFNKKSNYFTGDENRILFSSTDSTYTFAPDAENSGKYQHSKKTSWGWDLSGNTVNRNMDLSYRVYFNLSGIGRKIKNNFWTIDIDDGKYSIRVYEFGGIKNCKFAVNVSEAQIDTNSIALSEKNVLQWKSKFESLEKEPKKIGNYDHWIELWNNEYQTAFGSSFVPGNVTYDKYGGQRPRKIWSEVIVVPALSWKDYTVEI
ncbi:DUF262 domain-containing protein [Butyrivibrio sp. NC3005]|uniref:DUF262 domain-containing protein n=1 Tax=Butyrivibrio sp. NC3005 TaxID=1280685 RepID=UPI00040CFC02|nr:DUF262 domain-containing protein [Butyrivibrio sp. NC3005]